MSEWNPIETAPIACTVLATYFNPIYGEWVVEIVVAERAKAPFTHWQLITNPDDDIPSPKQNNHSHNTL
jgi:hypothetical protein